MEKHLAITGIPGSGKTTLARALGAALGRTVVGTGDIARAVDPAGLAAGGMADEPSFRAGWYRYLGQVGMAEPLIFDGIPRSWDQLELLPANTKVFLLTCRPDIAKKRLLLRGRADDTEDIINRRISEQSVLLEVDIPDGWIWNLVRPTRSAASTSQKPPERVFEDVLAYITGAKRDPY